MKTLLDVIEGGNLMRKVNRQFGLSNTMTQMLQSHQKLENHLSGFISMHQALLKGIGNQQTLYAKNYSGIEFLAKSMQQQFGIPSAAFEITAAIEKQHNHLFGNLRSFASILNKNTTFSQINSLQIALGGMSKQLASIASKSKQWNLLDDYEEISNEAGAINEKIFDDKGITKDRLKEILSFFESNGIRVGKIDSDASIVFWKILTILSFILGVTGEIHNWTPKPNYATKEEIEGVVKNQFSTFESKLKIKEEYRTTNRVCKVRVKPTNRTFVLAILPIDFDVLVLKFNHKWVYISYKNPKDNLPQTGWLMKKYLSLPDEK